MIETAPWIPAVMAVIFGLVLIIFSGPITRINKTILDDLKITKTKDSEIDYPSSLTIFSGLIFIIIGIFIPFI